MADKNRIESVVYKELVTIHYVREEDGLNTVTSEVFTECDYTDSVKEAIKNGVLSGSKSDIADWVREDRFS